MSNYPNMSYCMCENTMLALRQVIEAMQEDGVEFRRDMSREESRAFEELFHLCEQFVREAEELQNDYEESLEDE